MMVGKATAIGLELGIPEDQGEEERETLNGDLLNRLVNLPRHLISSLKKSGFSIG